MKHLLKLADLGKADILRILNLADQLKYNQKHGFGQSGLRGKTLVMLFNKSSTRTRVSFETGMYQLGGHAVFLTGADSQIGRGESAADTARVLSRYADGIMVRTYGQDEVEQLALHSSVPVINGLTDYAHPCQVLADLMTIREHLTVLDGLKACFIGDGNNVCNSLIVGAAACGMTVTAACPEGHEPHPDAVAAAGAAFTLTRSPRQAARDADVVFTDVWASMGQEGEAAARAEAFKGFQVNAELMALAKPGAIVQHCLPAHKGEEITEEVFEAHAREIFDEAENRLHAQKAVMLLLMGDGAGA
ncbi:MAG: ornithine carbamoyltransferase [Oscillospiraceae bacterium]|jgi:ornithine carbamoyltransferase|nr:ornithine carbamoyltransferase [Oscillospiraceae bacterium]